MLITYLLIIVPSVFFVINVSFSYGMPMVIVAAATTATVLVSFSLTACSDPGIVYNIMSWENVDNDNEDPERQDNENNDYKYGGISRPSQSSRLRALGCLAPKPPPTYHNASMIDCGACGLKRPSNANHCYDCGVCVEDLDHHCPWTGKCIGKNNIRYFYIFLLSLSVHIIFVTMVTVISVIQGTDVLGN
jgi:palmitoyltransferase ZDHHC9/14/18